MVNTILTVQSGAQIRSFHESGHWRDETIYELVRANAETTPTKVAIRETHRAIDYRGLVDAADRLAGELRRRGVRPGQRVAVWLPGRIETAVAVLACSRDGYVCCPSLHRDHTVAEIVTLLERMRAVVLIAEPGYGADGNRRDVFGQARQLTDLRVVLRAEPVRADPVFPDLPPMQDRAIRRDPDTVVYLPFTSGTTGEPKGVLHSDNTVLAATRAMALDWALGRDVVVYSLSPVSHNLGFGAMVMTLTCGGQFVIHDLSKGASLFDRLRDTGATFLFGVPTHAIDLLAELRQRGLSGIAGLKGFRISGAAVPPTVAAQLLEHGIVPQSGYGMTEAGSHHYTLPDDAAETIVGSSGRPYFGYEVAVFSRTDPDIRLPTGEIGQIGGRGPSLMLGYFDDQRSTEESFNAEGWFLTGDLGWIDDAGRLHITGRKKDVIIRGGHNILPGKIENLALGHEAIDKAAVIPVPDDRLGERVCLALTLRPGRRLSATELLAYLDTAGLSQYDMPEYILRLDDMPLGASGKIMKRQLLEWVKQGKVAPEPVRFQPSARSPEPAG